MWPANLLDTAGGPTYRTGSPASSTLTGGTPPTSIDERITTAITDANRPLPIGELRSLCRVRNGTLYERLTALTDAGQIVRGPEGYRLAAVP
jgi:hypothetical protein